MLWGPVPQGGPRVRTTAELLPSSVGHPAPGTHSTGASRIRQGHLEGWRDSECSLLPLGLLCPCSGVRRDTHTLMAGLWASRLVAGDRQSFLDTEGASTVLEWHPRLFILPSELTYTLMK